MINSRELRRGNLVKCLVHLPIGFNIKKLFHSEIVEIRCDTVETNEGFYKYRDVAPLPLTEDILLKSGGKKNESHTIVFESSNTDIPDLYIFNDMDSFYLCTEHGDKISKEIESVHHFQNLYYAIRGREIEITLENPKE